MFQFGQDGGVEVDGGRGVEFLIFLQRIGTDVWEDLLTTVGQDADVHGKLLFSLGKWSARSDR